MSVLPTSFASQLEYDRNHGTCCWECGEYFNVTYGAPTLCTTTCWTNTDPEVRGGFIKADRNTEERVIMAKKRNAKPPTQRERLA